jgi:AbrB family looped-hinge helix DNA binding protein
MHQEGAKTLRRAKITRGGRVAIPAEFCEALGLREGDTVLFELEGRGLHIMRPEAVVTRNAGISQDYANDAEPFDRDRVWDKIVAERLGQPNSEP